MRAWGGSGGVPWGLLYLLAARALGRPTPSAPHAPGVILDVHLPLVAYKLLLGLTPDFKARARGRPASSVS